MHVNLCGLETGDLFVSFMLAFVARACLLFIVLCERDCFLFLMDYEVYFVSCFLKCIRRISEIMFLLILLVHINVLQ